MLIFDFLLSIIRISLQKDHEHSVSDGLKKTLGEVNIESAKVVNQLLKAVCNCLPP